ncbi:MAG TPA: hypothetical protein VF774_17350 [Pseudoduganella sp.]|jgi:hypothetical protein
MDGLAAVRAQDAARAAATGSSSASVKIGDEASVATITGHVGIVTMNGDTVRLNHGTVDVNEVSFGAVPEVCEIRYVVTKTSRTLFVDGHPRSAPARR